MHPVVVIYYEGFFWHHVGMFKRDLRHRICHNAEDKEESCFQGGMLESYYTELYEYTLLMENHTERIQKNIPF